MPHRQPHRRQPYHQGRRLAALPLATVLVMGLALGGCSVRPPMTEPTPTTSVSVTVGVPTDASPAPTVFPAPTPLASGQKLVASASHGVKFAVPKSWSVLDLTTFDDPDVRKALEPLAKELGKTVDAYVEDLTKNHDLIVTGPEKSGYSPSVSVRKEEAQTLGSLPTTEKAAADIAGVNGTLEAVTAVTTPIGPGYEVAYSRPDAAANATRYSATLVIPSATGTVFLCALEAASAADRDAVASGIVATLQKA